MSDEVDLPSIEEPALKWNWVSFTFDELFEFIAGDNSGLNEFKYKTFEVYWNNEIHAGETLIAPLVYDGKIFMGLGDGCIIRMRYCWEKPTTLDFESDYEVFGKISFKPPTWRAEYAGWLDKDRDRKLGFRLSDLKDNEWTMFKLVDLEDEDDVRTLLKPDVVIRELIESILSKWDIYREGWRGVEYVTRDETVECIESTERYS